MCLCKENQWCRFFEETQNGKYPISEHAPGCPEYKQEEFTVLEYDGTRCVVEPHEADGILADENYSEDGVDYKVSTILLTRDQFDKLKEFDGF